MALKDNLKKLREDAGYEQAKDFAKAADIPYSSYSVYERGSWPNETNLLKIAKALHVSVDTLLGYDPDQPDEQEKVIAELKKYDFHFMGYTDGDGDEPGDPPNLIFATGFDKKTGKDEHIFDVSKSELLAIQKATESSPKLKECIHDIYLQAFKECHYKQMQKWTKGIVDNAKKNPLVAAVLKSIIGVSESSKDSLSSNENDLFQSLKKAFDKKETTKG